MIHVRENKQCSFSLLNQCVSWPVYIIFLVIILVIIDQFETTKVNNVRCSSVNVPRVSPLAAALSRSV